MVNKTKGGLIRIIEVSISILIISTIVILFSVVRNIDIDDDLEKIGAPLLDEVSRNNTLRERIITGENFEDIEAEIMNFLESRIKNSGVEYQIKICEVDADPCIINYPEGASGNVYASSRIISATPYSSFNPRILKFFVWR
jgi:hypothetical protein